MKEEFRRMGSALLRFELGFMIGSSIWILFGQWAVSVLQRAAAADFLGTAEMVSGGAAGFLCGVLVQGQELMSAVTGLCVGLYAAFSPTGSAAFSPMYAFTAVKKELHQARGFAAQKCMSWQTAAFVILFLCGTQFLFSKLSTLLEALANGLGLSLLSELEAAGGVNTSLPNLLYIVILGPAAEELMFRGMALRALKPYGKCFAILGSALAFAAYHANLPQALFAFPLGLLFAWLALEYSFCWALLFHMAAYLFGKWVVL